MNAPTSINALSLVQKNYSLLKNGGDFFIIDEQELQKYRLGKIKSNLSIYKQLPGRMAIERFLTEQPVPGIPRQVYNQFLIDPDSHVYEDIKFHPQTQTKDVLNLWIPPTIEPMDTDCDDIVDFIYTVISNSNQTIFEYLMNYLAHLYQKPEDKPGVMIALMSGQGCGKGVFMQLLQRIWSRTTYVVSDIESIIGRFNIALERNLIVCMDEALYVNNNAGQERLKSLITEPYITVEEKHHSARTVNSLHRFILATNHEHFLKTSNDDRRLFAIPISEKYQNNHHYFNNLIQIMKNTNQLNGFVKLLSEKNLEHFNVRQRPRTAIHTQQILRSLDKVDRWIYHILNTKCIGFNNKWTDSDFFSYKDLKDVYLEFDHQAQKYQTIQNEDIKSAIKKLIPDAKEHRSANARGYILPHIDLARDSFEHIVGGKIEWEVE